MFCGKSYIWSVYNFLLQIGLVWFSSSSSGAIDGKHIVIQAPSNSRSLYYNYKGMYSVLLLAVYDANYRFITFDIGEAGKESHIFKLITGPVSRITIITTSSGVPDVTDVILLYVFIGDEGFPLLKDVMQPFPGKNLPDDEAIFNYCLSRARRIIENTFSILTARFRIFRCPINATIALHNYL